jgi:hypothetical protein
MDLVNTEDGTDKSKENATLRQGICSIVLAATFCSAVWTQEPSE